MKTFSNQALIGGFVAAVLMIGASAAPNGEAAQGDLSLGSLAPFRHEAIVQMEAVVDSARDLLLDAAFDAYGEIAAQLKQM